MNLYLFKGSPTLDGETDNYDLYVRSESLKDAAQIVIDYYNWTNGKTAKQIIENYVAQDWHIELIKTYAKPVPMAGAISFREVERLLHEVL